MELKIEKGVPVPSLGHASGISNALRLMKPGDSTYVPAEHKDTVRRLATSIFKKGNYTTRSVGGGLRLWRRK